MRTPWVIGAALAAAAPVSAAADPCRGPLPARPGESFAGLVRYVGDGDSLCVGAAEDPATWIEVRIADFDAPELGQAGGERAKALLAAVALGRHATCIASAGRTGRVVVYDRVVAVCRVGGRPLGDLLRERDAPSGRR